jgi:hypothetical protein
MTKLEEITQPARRKPKMSDIPSISEMSRNLDHIKKSLDKLKEGAGFVINGKTICYPFQNCDSTDELFLARQTEMAISVYEKVIDFYKQELENLGFDLEE